MGQNVKVTSVQLLNQDLKDVGAMDAEEYAQFFESRDGAFKWAPDGVVNNLDGADPENQFKDFALANVAIQGFVRFSTLPFGDETRGHNFPHLFTQKGARNGDRVFLALVSRPAAGAAGEARRRRSTRSSSSSRRTSRWARPTRTRSRRCGASGASWTATSPRT